MPLCFFSRDICLRLFNIIIPVLQRKIKPRYIEEHEKPYCDVKFFKKPIDFDVR